MRAAAAVLALVLTSAAHAAEPPTVVEAESYARTSLYAEVVDFVTTIARGSELVAVRTLTTSPEGRAVPLVVLSRERVRTPAELRASGKPAVLIMANIHAGEVEGKEACQMLIRDVAAGPLASLLDRQVVLVLPIFNADGNDKLGKNRRDDGPELAGVRHNGQYLDLNRDYVKLESPEVSALVRLLNEWDPIVVVDMHTTNGSHHRHPVTYTTGSHPNGAKAIFEYMWGRLFPAVSARLRDHYGWESVPYGNFADRRDPEKGWENDTFEARYGANYVGLRNRLAILDENYSYADFKTRVRSSYDLVKSILEYTSAHAAEIVALVRQADADTRDGFSREAFAPEWGIERLLDVTVKSFEFTREELTAEENARYPWYGGVRMVPTKTHRDYSIPYLARAVPRRTVPLPAAYAILPGQDEVVRILRAHGLVVERLGAPARLAAERFAIQKVTPASSLYQGRVMITLAGAWEQTEAELPTGTLIVDLRQPLARLVPVLLEPSSADSLAAWGFFNRTIVRQWSPEPGVLPVLRLATRPPAPLLVLE